MTDQSARGPDRKIRSGRVSAALWATQKKENGRTFTQWSVKVEKRFRDDDSGDWRSSTTFFPNELADLELVARRAREICRLQDGDPPSEDEVDDAQEPF